MSSADLPRAAAAFWKGKIRRYKDAFWRSRETRDYERWIAQRLIDRRAKYGETPEPGLFSIVTPVWDGSPVKYLNALARSIAPQNENGASEWVVVDNGCSRPDLLGALGSLGGQRWVKLIRLDSNRGIIHGMRRCLEEASGRYILPVDADDLLYPDALRIVASAVKAHDYPVLLYTDEDKAIGSRFYQPYLKPGWDPVLLLNSAYIAHLGVIDREKALALGAYSDVGTEGSPDWDLFVRFLIAGYEGVHIPEVAYSWRVHARSTADDDASKTYIGSSQRRVLQRYLDAHPHGAKFELEQSPLFAGGAHWHFRRKPDAHRKISTTSPDATQEQLTVLAQRKEDLIAFVHPELTLTNPDWQLEAAGIFELHSDTVMVGGRIENETARSGDPGYFGQHWKQRSVDAVSKDFAVIEPEFLSGLLAQGVDAATYAARTRRRLVYSPFLSATVPPGSSRPATHPPASPSIFSRAGG